MKKNSKEKLVKNYFNQLIKSIENNDINLFMEFQNGENKLFYKEQERWIDEIINQKRLGFKFYPKIDFVELSDSEKGLLHFSLEIERPSGRKKIHKVQYNIIRNSNNQWKINDYPFYEKINKNIYIYYFKDNEKMALIALNYLEKIMGYFKQLFNWEPKIIPLKLYSTLDQISLSVPWFALYGWNEEQESIKLLIPSYEQNKKLALFKLLVHELCHKLLSNICNDNASLYIQEGLALYFEKGLKKNKEKVFFNKEQLINHLVKVLNNEDGRLLSIEELNRLTYNDGLMLYNHGFLLVYFLIEKYGLKTIEQLASNLKKYNYIDKRSIYKLDVINQRTTSALIDVYGPMDSLLEEMKHFYKNILL
jgi:hypothetical protein